jgi:hypothetical protein
MGSVAEGQAGRSGGGLLPEIRSDLKEELRRHILDIAGIIAIYRKLHCDAKRTSVDLSETANGLWA